MVAGRVAGFTTAVKVFESGPVPAPLCPFASILHVPKFASLGRV